MCTAHPTPRTLAAARLSRHTLLPRAPASSAASSRACSLSAAGSLGEPWLHTASCTAINVLSTADYKSKNNTALGHCCTLEHHNNAGTATCWPRLVPLLQRAFMASQLSPFGYRIATVATTSQNKQEKQKIKSKFGCTANTSYLCCSPLAWPCAAAQAPCKQCCQLSCVQPQRSRLTGTALAPHRSPG
jgi:hypothetical protein